MTSLQKKKCSSNNGGQISRRERNKLRVADLSSRRWHLHGSYLNSYIIIGWFYSLRLLIQLSSCDHHLHLALLICRVFCAVTLLNLTVATVSTHVSVCTIFCGYFESFSTASQLFIMGTNLKNGKIKWYVSHKGKMEGKRREKSCKKDMYEKPGRKEENWLVMVEELLIGKIKKNNKEKSSPMKRRLTR